MVFDVIPVLLMFTSFATIVVIIGRRLPQIAALNVEEMVEAQTATKKRQLLLERLEARMKTLAVGVWGSTATVRQRAAETLGETYDKLQRLDRRHRFAVAEQPAEVVVRDMLVAADAAREEERWRDAEQLYLDVLRLDDHNRNAYVGLGYTYRGLEQFEESAGSFEFALRLKGDDMPGWADLADIYTQLGRIDDAVRAYRHVVALDPTNSDYLIVMGDLLVQNGQLDAALQVFTDAVERESSNPRCLDRLIETAIACGQKKTAQMALRKLKKVNKDNQKIEEFDERIRAL